MRHFDLTLQKHLVLPAELFIDKKVFEQPYLEEFSLHELLSDVADLRQTKPGSTDPSSFTRTYAVVPLVVTLINWEYTAKLVGFYEEDEFKQRALAHGLVTAAFISYLGLDVLGKRLAPEDVLRPSGLFVIPAEVEGSGVFSTIKGFKHSLHLDVSIFEQLSNLHQLLEQANRTALTHTSNGTLH